MSKNMNSNIFLRYYFGVPKTADEFDLSDLGKSLIGFEKLCKHLEKITRINGNVSLQAQGLREGSLLIDVLVKLEEVDHLAPFDQFEYLLEFLQLANSQYYQVALNYFQQISSKIKSVEDIITDYKTLHRRCMYPIENINKWDIDLNGKVGLPDAIDALKIISGN